MIGKIGRVIVILAILVFLGVKFLPFGYSKFTSRLTDKTLEVPNLVTLDGECCEYAATFRTLRSVWSLEREIERILEENYREVLCASGDKFYYDEGNDLTIRGYRAKWKFPFNEVVISYGMGKGC